MTGLITDEMRGLIGRPYATATSFPIDLSAIMRWAIAVYYPEPPPPEYWDEEYAATTPSGGIIAPAEFNPFAWMSRRATTSDAAIEVDPALPGREPSSISSECNPRTCGSVSTAA
jgi:hypothetical protein